MPSQRRPQGVAFRWTFHTPNLAKRYLFRWTFHTRCPIYAIRLVVSRRTDCGTRAFAYTCRRRQVEIAPAEQDCKESAERRQEELGQEDRHGVMCASGAIRSTGILRVPDNTDALQCAAVLMLLGSCPRSTGTFDGRWQSSCRMYESPLQETS